MPLAPMASLALVLLSGPPPAQDPARPPETVRHEAPEGLRGLFAAGIIQGKSGIAAKQLVHFTTQASTPPLTVRTAYAYRSRLSIAVALRLHNPASATEWRAGHATLRQVDTGTELPSPQVWQAEALGPEGSAWVVVEIAATEEQARGTYTLVLWEAGGTRPLTLEGVTFP